MKVKTMNTPNESLMPTEYRYFVVEYYAKPKNPNKTHIKDYMNDEENKSYDEIVSFAKRIKPAIMTKASLILDLHECKVVKCRAIYEADSFPKLLKFYIENHPEEFAHYAPHLIPRQLEKVASV